MARLVPLMIIGVLVILFPSEGEAFIEGIYCGKDNCYDVLGIRRDDSTFKDVARAYRKLALQWHPDRHKGEEAKNIATEKFRLIAAAYEVLRDEESRKDYDYMLDNPEEMYHHYYRYYRRMYAPKVDVRIVLVVTISLISAYQYYAYNSRFNEAIDYFVTVPKYRMKAQEIAIEEGIWPTTATTSDGKTRLKQRGPNKQNVKQILKNEEETAIRKVVEEMMDIKGAYSKPTYKDLLWVQLFLLPVYIVQFFYFHLRWIYKFYIRKEEYGLEEKHYLIRKFMGLNESQWAQREDHEIEEYMKKELWLKENFVPWQKEQEDEMKVKLAESSAYKRYRRNLKKGGPGQITFQDD